MDFHTFLLIMAVLLLWRIARQTAPRSDWDSRPEMPEWLARTLWFVGIAGALWLTHFLLGQFGMLN